jgi:hypothetical protein
MWRLLASTGRFPASLHDLGLMGDCDLSFTMRWMIFRGFRRRRLFVVLESKEGKKLSIELTVLLMGSRCVGSEREDAEGALKAPYLGLQGIFPFVRLMLPECFPGCLLRIVVVRFKRDGRWRGTLSAGRISGLI